MSDLHPEFPFFVNLLLLLVAARFLGELMERYNQPAMIGEILAGIILGPSLLQLIQFDVELKVVSEMAVFLLIIIAGIEINPKELQKAFRGKNIWISVLAFVIPIASGILLGAIFQLNIMITTFLSLCISITALPVSVRILMDLKKLNTDIGQKIITVAIFNDVIALMILGILIDSRGEQNTYSEIAVSVGYTLLKVLAFLLIIALAYRLVDNASKRGDVIKTQLDKIVLFLKGKESLFAILFCFILLFASISELVGLHFVVGAFFAAMLLTKEVLGAEHHKTLEKTTTAITMGFLAPVFFAAIGLQFNIVSLDNIPLLISVIVVSFASKIIGGYLGARLSGMKHQPAITMGVGLNARGIMELVIANIALHEKIISISLFSILVVMGMLTTIVTPFLLKRAFDRMEKIN